MPLPNVWTPGANQYVLWARRKLTRALWPAGTLIAPSGGVFGPASSIDLLPHTRTGAAVAGTADASAVAPLVSGWAGARPAEEGSAPVADRDAPNLTLPAAGSVTAACCPDPEWFSSATATPSDPAATTAMPNARAAARRPPQRARTLRRPCEPDRFGIRSFPCAEEEVLHAQGRAKARDVDTERHLHHTEDRPVWLGVVPIMCCREPPADCE